MIETLDRVQTLEDFYADLLESAYLNSLIDGEAQLLAYMWLATNAFETH